ncbi:MAG: hypothetical protein QXJ76_08310, partial [Candidatus Bathyarchaeia archaeon]
PRKTTTPAASKTNPTKNPKKPTALATAPAEPFAKTPTSLAKATNPPKIKIYGAKPAKTERSKPTSDVNIT